ncbi:hypothetical protein [Caulobacter sp. NIBR2454]|uniref:hypothetical protein n=1 Tax=Caulobacter sp. NIBR2454 TaxID=3015996 RepID=UPI0022B6B194|nr:hypothetical protein [Caulobacter sp. NIBR2454]
MLGGCWLDFREEPARVGLPLRALAAAGPGVRIEFKCQACGYARAVTPGAIIARLKADKLGDENTLHTALPDKLTRPCKTCWTLRVEWREPRTPQLGEAAKAYDRRMRS